MKKRLFRCGPIMAVAFAVLWVGLFQETSEARAAQTAVESSNPLSGDADAIQTGKRLFTENCTLCHGRKANGRTGRWTSADLTKFRKGYSRFLRIVQKGVKPKRGSNNQMQPWEKFLNDEQITMIGAYLETLAGRGAKWVDPK